MTSFEQFQISFFIAFWFYILHLSVVLLYISTRKAMQQYRTSKKIKAGKIRCDAFFYCHCEKVGQHEKHVNETNMVVWE